jgi:TonB family protein
VLQKKVQPIYPPSSRKNKEEGVSVIGAIISEEGCVEFPEVLQSATPTLDIMAMEGVTRWRYQPASLDGRPVRVFLTVSVNFHLTP